MTTKQINVAGKPLTPELLGKMDAYWRAANYLSVGQIHLLCRGRTSSGRRIVR
jgi:xylulose-5-phosphate/fructose-6-phosphate phosphoketolase